MTANDPSLKTEQEFWCHFSCGKPIYSTYFLILGYVLVSSLVLRYFSFSGRVDRLVPLPYPMPRALNPIEVNREVSLVEPIFGHKFVGSSESDTVGHCLRVSAANIPPCQ